MVSSSSRFSFKPRDELDAMIEEFDRDITHRINELRAHCDAYADTILSMTDAADDQYVYRRINRVLQSHRLLSETPQMAGGVSGSSNQPSQGWRPL